MKKIIIAKGFYSPGQNKGTAKLNKVAFPSTSYNPPVSTRLDKKTGSRGGCKCV